MVTYTRDNVSRSADVDTMTDYEVIVTDSAGYIPADREISNLLRAGALLEDWRRRGGYDSDDPTWSEDAAVDLTKLSGDELQMMYREASYAASKSQKRIEEQIRLNALKKAEDERLLKLAENAIVKEPIGPIVKPPVTSAS